MTTCVCVCPLGNTGPYTGLRHWHLPQGDQTSKACSVIKVTFDRLHPVRSHAHNVARIDKCRNSRAVSAKAEGSGDCARLLAGTSFPWGLVEMAWNERLWLQS